MVKRKTCQGSVSSEMFEQFEIHNEEINIPDYRHRERKLKAMAKRKALKAQNEGSFLEDIYRNTDMYITVSYNNLRAYKTKAKHV